MAFRLFHRIKIAPGITLNLSKSGLSASAGVRGARVTLGPRGGISYTDSSSTSSRPRRSRSSTRPTDDEAHEQVSSAQGCLTIIVVIVIVAILAAIGSS
jgi:hypothetical protein